jgi:hypothetical protein
MAIALFITDYLRSMLSRRQLQGFVGPPRLFGVIFATGVHALLLGRSGAKRKFRKCPFSLVNLRANA